MNRKNILVCLSVYVYFFISVFVSIVGDKAYALPSFKKVMIVVFENADYKDVINQPFFEKLAKKGALFTNFHAEARPSQPNYIALVSGDTHGCNSNDNIDIDAPNITDLLEKKSKELESVC